ncbi:ABC transporter substrate-binding protein [Desulfosarcina cetonica]|uniref:ABC transporter substrate-binding protein n=1 Tax=Desulfosarcina cetonica TaxID=90730 RepID=UPI0009F871B9|nr:ABC transporter substrate-binding protein [Desulfosarcina cetonica]
MDDPLAPRGFFHPGPQTAAYELTAEDVVFSLGKAADAAFSAYASEYEGLDVAIVDRYTVRIRLSTPLSPILFLPKLTNYAGGFIVSQRAFEAMGHDAFAKHPVGTGPFVFQRYDPGSALVLTAYDGYFRGRPQLDGVTIRFLPDIHRREAAFKRGELDVIAGSGEKGWIASVDALKGIVVDTFGVGEVATLYFNTRMPPMDDRRVRKAIAYALDRNQFSRCTSPRLVGKAFSPVPTSLVPGGLSPAECVCLGLDYATDLSRSRQLLAEAGYADGFLLDLVTSEKRLYRAYYESIRDQLARIGIRCRIHIQTHAQMHRTIRQAPRALVVYVPGGRMRIPI